MVYDSVFGVGLIATWLTSLLFGICVIQAIHYLRDFPNDILLKRSILVVVFVLETGALATQCARMYLQTVTYWGNPESFVITAPVSVLCSSLLGFIVNTFLIHRFYAVSKNLIVAVILFVFNLGTFVASLFFLRLLVNQVGKIATPATLQSFIPAATAWGAAGAVTGVSLPSPLLDVSRTDDSTDVCIATSLVWTLRGMKTTFKDTTELLQHIMAISIQNGCTTSAFSIAGMIANIVVPATNIDDLFFYLVGPLYLLTFLSNLTLRQSAPGARAWSSSEGTTDTVDSDTGITFGGVHVHRSVTMARAASEDIEGARTTESYVRFIIILLFAGVRLNDRVVGGQRDFRRKYALAQLRVRLLKDKGLVVAAETEMYMMPK
ncbi:hypothetical protein B0H16DRAFT_1796763 [Mycena metata]|uniref:DUF6534 domain-containing protein n=1 Tax=Mycena metata TaxID=1033252 RepID=A0AAD7NLD1_9AGAR|nr:hypothetical protein B0H16DRAFT_1796763 [Mycena metata]